MIKTFRIATILLGAASWAGAATEYTLTDLGTLSSTNVQGTQPKAINASGQVTGFSDINGTESHAFLYSKGTLTDLGTIGGQLSYGAGINAAGIVAGSASPYMSVGALAVVVAGGYMGSLGTLGGSYSLATGINDAGQIVGYSATSTANVTHAFVHNKDGSVEEYATPFQGAGTNSFAYAINDQGFIVGEANTAGDTYYHAFVKAPAQGLGFDLTPTLTTNSTAFAITNSSAAVALIVGSTGTQDTAAERAVIFASPTPTLLGDLVAGEPSRALGVNDAGVIVGFAGVGGGSHAFIYRSADATPVMVDLNTLIPASGIELTSATAINAAGQICAIGRDLNAANQYDRAYLISPKVAPTPPPAAPTVKATKKSVKTSGKTVTIRGTASGSVTNVTYRVGKKSGTAKGAANWSFKVTKLKVGKTVATIIAHGPGGNSAPVKVTITRSAR